MPQRGGEGSVSSPSTRDSLTFFVRVVRRPRPFPPEDVWGRVKRKQTRVTICFRNCIDGSPDPRNRRPTAEPEKASQGARAELDIAPSGPRTARSVFAAVVRIRHSPSPTDTKRRARKGSEGRRHCPPEAAPALTERPGVLRVGERPASLDMGGAEKCLAQRRTPIEYGR